MDPKALLDNRASARDDEDCMLDLKSTGSSAYSRSKYDQIVQVVASCDFLTGQNDEARRSADRCTDPGLNKCVAILHFRSSEGVRLV